MHSAFLINYAEFLSRQQQADRAITILRSSIPQLANEEERTKVWECILTIHSQYFVTRPIQEILQLEKEFAQSCPSEKTRGLLNRLSRYALWGVGI